MSPINERFPAIAEVLAETDFDKDLEDLDRIASRHGGGEALQEAINNHTGFRLHDLTPELAYAACNDLSGPWWQLELEAGLRIAIAAKGIEEVRANWRSKLLVRNRRSLEDAVYEVLVAGRAIQSA